MMKIIKVIVKVISVTLFIILVINFYVYTQGKKYISNSLDTLPTSQVVIILGAAILKDGNLSPVLKDRVDTALELYNQKKVPKILVTGNNSSLSYDEVSPVRRYLVKSGVKPQDIFLDHAGFDTYSSMYRAHTVFGITSAIIVTQDFHLPRALYTAKNLGLDAHGFSADKGDYLIKNNLRELLSRPNAFIDILFKRKPKYLGPSIPISGDGTITWN